MLRKLVPQLSPENFVQLPHAARTFALLQRTELLPRGVLRALLDSLWRRTGFSSYVRHIDRVADRRGYELDRKLHRIAAHEVNEFLPYLQAEPVSVLDIGCGLGLIDLHLYHALKGTNLFLVDKTSMSDVIVYGFEEYGAFYNSLALTASILVSGGVAKEHIHTMEAPETGVLNVSDKSIDLVISTLSWGFHYPIPRYLDSVLAVLSDRGQLVVDVRNGTDGFEVLARHFHLIEINRTITSTRVLGSFR